MDINDPVKSLVSRTVINGWTKLIVPGPVKHHESKRKFAELSGGIELFDLRGDPTENTNLAAQQPAEVERLRALLDAWWNID